MDAHGGDALTPENDQPPWWQTRGGFVLLGFAAIGAYFLITEHRAHLALAIPYLPWLLLLACPFMHLFMHGGHGGHGNSEPPERRNRTDP